MKRALTSLSNCNALQSISNFVLDFNNRKNKLKTFDIFRVLHENSSILILLNKIAIRSCQIDLNSIEIVIAMANVCPLIHDESRHVKKFFIFFDHSFN